MGEDTMSDLTTLDPEAIEHSAKAVGAIVHAVPGLQQALYETVKGFWTDPLIRCNRLKNLRHEFELAEEMIKGQKRVDDLSATLAKEVLEPAMEEDREELQKLWAALIARVMAGQDRRIRTEWFDLIRKFNSIDALVMSTLYEHQSDEAMISVPIDLDDIGQSVEHHTSRHYERADIKLSAESLMDRGCVEYGEDIEDATNSWLRKSYRLTTKGYQIARAVSPPAKAAD
ncbi:hypothetical protein AA12717_1783 [Gluconacetobacter sacchari DSM 12717]|nr:hypothetical protein AA12717_1783 [Gluconacetobacter sacchari DSM 12717]